jgi:putative SOS response-associated peptidase YedK
MCGRYVQHTDLAEIARLLDAIAAISLPPTWNAAPGQFHPVAVHPADEPVRIDRARWGLVPSWAKEPGAAQPINARSETLFERPMFRRIALTRRCLVPADGWYEWLETPSGKQPWYHCAADGQPLFFAGLWDAWMSPDGPLPTYTILTRDAVPELAETHDRMPVIVPHARRQAWLAPETTARDEVGALLAAFAPPPILKWPVGRAVGRSSAEGPQLIAKLTE